MGHYVQVCLTVEDFGDNSDGLELIALPRGLGKPLKAHRIERHTRHLQHNEGSPSEARPHLSLAKKNACRGQSTVPALQQKLY